MKVILQEKGMHRQTSQGGFVSGWWPQVRGDKGDDEVGPWAGEPERRRQRARLLEDSHPKVMLKHIERECNE